VIYPNVFLAEVNEISGNAVYFEENEGTERKHVSKALDTELGVMW